MKMITLKGNTMSNQTPIKVGSRVRFIKDIPQHAIKKGDYADATVVGVNFL